MARILLLHSSVDGHTVAICERLKQVVERHGHEAALASIDAGADADLRRYDKVVIGASIRFGHYRRQVFDFIAAHRPLLESKPNAFFSVNIVARKPGKDTPETNPYMRKFLRRSSWHPQHLAVFAGKLDYPRYGFVAQLAIRFIMLITKGPTDPTMTVEFTDWRTVDAFGQRISEM